MNFQILCTELEVQVKKLGEATTQFAIATRDAKVFRVIYIFRITILLAAVVVKVAGAIIAIAANTSKLVIYGANGVINAAGFLITKIIGVFVTECQFV